VYTRDSGPSIVDSTSVSLQSFGSKFPNEENLPVIKVTFLYPNNEGSTFHIEYYQTAHLQLSRDKFGSALKGLSIDKGTSGVEPGSKPPFHVAAQLLFESLDEFYAALAPNIEEFKTDALKYTNVEPVILISESIT
jgi:uncharacterized protein (TIGR02118 family)